MNTRDSHPLTPEERAIAERLARLDAHAMPSPALDARILAAAAAATRPAVAAEPVPVPSTRRPRRWPAVFGVAASLAVAVGVAWQLRPQPETHVLAVPAGPAPVPASGMDRTNVGPAAATSDALPAALPAPIERAAAPTVEQVATTTEDAAEAALGAGAPGQAVRIGARERQSAPATMAAPAPAAAEFQRPATAKAMPPPPPPPAPPPPPPPAPAAPSPAAASAAAAGIEAADAVSLSEVDALLRSEEPLRARRAPAETAPVTAVEQRLPTGSLPRARQATAATTMAEVDLLADQPLDDQPPASADSPQVRERWLQRIRELRELGDTAAARDSLREFMRRHPQADVPDDLRPLLDE